MFAYQLEDATAEGTALEETPVVSLPQLDPDCIYTVTETDLLGAPVELGKFRGGTTNDSFTTAWPLRQACTTSIWEFNTKD